MINYIFKFDRIIFFYIIQVLSFGGIVDQLPILDKVNIIHICWLLLIKLSLVLVVPVTAKNVTG